MNSPFGQLLSAHFQSVRIEARSAANPWNCSCQCMTRSQLASGRLIRCRNRRCGRRCVHISDCKRNAQAVESPHEINSVRNLDAGVSCLEPPGPLTTGNRFDLAVFAGFDLYHARSGLRPLRNPATPGNCRSPLRTRKRTHKRSLNLDREQYKSPVAAAGWGVVHPVSLRFSVSQGMERSCRLYVAA